MCSTTVANSPRGTDDSTNHGSAGGGGGGGSGDLFRGPPRVTTGPLPQGEIYIWYRHQGSGQRTRCILHPV